ncbi:hypothetical protein DL96DRAFT_1417767, partial [Flagelloscypha sp. PMI_526]
CNKCQGFGHVVVECLGSQRPRCRECTEEHDTRDCKLGSNDKRTCYNCKQDGHGARSRGCLYFIKKLEEYNKHNPENTMPLYFDPEDATTW